MDRLGDSEMSRPTTLNGRRMRTLPQLDRRTMHPGRRMLTLAITRFNAGMDGFSALLSAFEPPIVATVGAAGCSSELIYRRDVPPEFAVYRHLAAVPIVARPRLALGDPPFVLMNAIARFCHASPDALIGLVSVTHGREKITREKRCAQL
ncbi:hypothetical protein ALC62_07610 [Cyphomyrmex costatus]|uniref:Uncharacterized protein n=1 Tax=Cyphomyrmex costatus TaxID=456900 RepID=A0A195CLQ8_9HYME|nr:hypothetical protein ALC62_07610 [Cyphomyrmex costatus]